MYTENAVVCLDQELFCATRLRLGVVLLVSDWPNL